MAGLSQTKAMAATTDDFTFPTITDSTFSFSIDSPPLWCLSPSASPDCTSQKKKTAKSNERLNKDSDLISKESTAQRRSFSFVEPNKEDKMDMLWEDFNDELSPRSNDGSSKLDSGSVNMGCVRALRLSRSDGAVFSPKSKPSLLVFIKVLKKFFLLQNSHTSINKNPHFSWST